jgi:hypothetical protein
MVTLFTESVTVLSVCLPNLPLSSESVTISLHEKQGFGPVCRVSGETANGATGRDHRANLLRQVTLRLVEIIEPPT